MSVFLKEKLSLARDQRPPSGLDAHRRTSLQVASKAEALPNTE